MHFFYTFANKVCSFKKPCAIPAQIACSPSAVSVSIINYYTCQSALYHEALCIISVLHLCLSR